jgi:hypothetical protein
LRFQVAGKNRERLAAEQTCRSQPGRERSVPLLIMTTQSI